MPHIPYLSGALVSLLVGTRHNLTTKGKTIVGPPGQTGDHCKRIPYRRPGAAERGRLRAFWNKSD